MWLTALPASPIGLVVPAAAAAATYNGTITFRNSTAGCSSAALPFTVTVNAVPTITLGQAPQFVVEQQLQTFLIQQPLEPQTNTVLFIMLQHLLQAS